MIRFVLALLALLSLFILPWQAAALCIVLAAFALPPAGVLLGITGDLLYYLPGASFVPYFSVIGLLGTVASLFVHRFVKTRIMEG